ncbi:ABC transporter permease subunit [Cohnella hashimotonis]|uniref:DUF5711 family protein n=1 Tax=Cohnella hashimotonis TaxID=2826895 RepID=A0ABT6TJL0_9BACL|nr:ABC transporter permease subunit [Cohnella hashimotonis]MDI4647021.1 DUF5711 family protein [Cohnella hashimotonis]
MKLSAMLSAVLGVIVLFAVSSPVFAARTQWTAGQAQITSLSVRADGQAVAVGTYDAKVSVFDGDGQPLFDFKTKNVVTATAYLNDGSLLVASDDRHLYRIDSEGSVVWDRNLKRPVTGVASAGDGSAIVALLKGSKSAYVYDRDGQPLKEIDIGIQPRKVDVSGNGEWIALGGSDQYIYLLNASHEQVGKYSASGTIDALSVTDQGRVVAGTSSHQVFIFDREGAEPSIFTAADSVTAVAATDDGSYVAVSDFAGNDYVLDGGGDQLWQAASGKDGAGRAVAVSNDGSLLFKGSSTGVVQKLEIGSAIAVAKHQALQTRIVALVVAAVGAGLLAWLFYFLKKSNRLGIFGAIWRERFSYLMLLPTFGLIAMFLYYPAFSGLFHSFYDWKPGGRSTFVGLANYRRMFGDPYVIKGLGNLALLMITGLFKTIVPPLVVAELIYYLRRKGAQYWFRTAFVVSMIIPSVASLLIWQNFYDPNVGLLNQVLQAIGLGGWAHSWLGDPHTAIWAIIFMGFPFIGIMSLLLFYAGLISIPQDAIESAKIDGAGAARIIRSLHLPFLAGQMKLLIILAFIGIIQDFGSILIVTRGGPLDSTYVPALQMYFAATQFNDLGYASALGVAMFAIILALTIVNMKFMKSSTD